MEKRKKEHGKETKTIDPNHGVPDPEISLGRTLESNGACHAFRFDCSVYVTDRHRPSLSLFFSFFFLRLIPRIANSFDPPFSNLSDYLFAKDRGFD